MPASSSLRFATWNIGGGILGASHQKDGRPNLDYITSFLERARPDILCLQEAHSYDDLRESQSKHIASRVGFPHVVEFPISESHMEHGARLSLGILSQFSILQSSYTQFPNPGLSAVGPNGDKWRLFDKGILVGRIAVAGREIGVLNAHCFPLHYFNADPTEPRFSEIWQLLIKVLTETASTAPVLAAIDLNHDRIDEVLGSALGPLAYTNTIRRTPTTPKGVQQDYILNTRPFLLRAVTVEPTKCDHAYCEVDIALPATR